jgi:glycosyltransferase involved in cell wall biosynthesis
VILVVDGIVYGQQHFGGINTLFGNVLPALAHRHGVEVVVLAPRDSVGERPSAPVAVSRRDWLPTRPGLSHRLDAVLEPWLERVAAAGRNLWIRRKADVFMSTYFTDAPTGMPAVAVAFDMSHELFPELYDTPFGTWLRRRYPVYLRAASRVLAISETTRRHVVEIYRIPEDRVDVVPLATDPRTFHAERQTTAAEPYLLYVGGRWSYKNFPFMLEAVARGFSQLGLSLVVAGPPWTPSELADIERLKLTERVRLSARPSDDVLRRLYSNAFAFVFPSLHEGFGLPLLEAMSCGTPVLASDTPIFREVAGTAPAYFDPRDVDSLLAATARLLDAATRARHVADGLARVARYSWSATADGIYASCARASAG